MIEQWGIQGVGAQSAALPISYTKWEYGVGIHYGLTAVITVYNYNYVNSLNEVSYYAFSPDGTRNNSAEIRYITIGV